MVSSLCNPLKDCPTQFQEGLADLDGGHYSVRQLPGSVTESVCPSPSGTSTIQYYGSLVRSSRKCSLVPRGAWRRGAEVQYVSYDGDDDDDVDDCGAASVTAGGPARL